MTRTTPDARWLELCMDTVSPDGSLGRFWAAVVGGEHVARRGDPVGDVVVREPEGGSIAMCLVPEPRTVKHRVHLDVYTADVADLEALGARMLLPAAESGFGWSQMTDPEGGEFCAFVREPERLPAYRLHGVGIDSVDAEAAARWWGARFGVEPVNEPGTDWWTLEHVTNDPVLTLDFAPVPEPKTVKNRVHWDVYGAVADFERAGATVLWEMPRWTAMADPEGNEFCVFPEPS